MSLSENVEKGISKSGFVPRENIDFVNNMVVSARSLLGPDLSAAESGNAFVALCKAVGGELEYSEQQLTLFADQRTPANCDSIYLDDLGEERSIQRQAALRATGIVRIDKTGSDEATVPSGTLLTNAAEGAAIVEYKTTESVIYPAVYEIRRGINGQTDYLSQQPEYTKLLNLLSVDSCNSLIDGSGTEYLLGYDFEGAPGTLAYTAGDDRFTWITGQNEPTGAANYYPVCEVILEIERDPGDDIDVYGSTEFRMTDYAKWAPLDQPGSVGTANRTFQIIAVNSQADMGGIDYFNQTPKPDFLTNPAQASWAGVTTKPTGGTKYYVHGRFQQYMTRGGTPNTSDDIDVGVSTDVINVVAVYDSALIEGIEASWLGTQDWIDYTGATPDYFFGPGEDMIIYVSGDNKVNFAPGKSVSGNAYYYLTSSGVSAYVNVRAEEEGADSNLPAGDLNTFDSPITDISNVVNEDDINTGADAQSDEVYRDDIENATYVQKNRESLVAHIKNLPAIRAVKAVEDLGKYILVVDAVYYPITQVIYSNVMAAIEDFVAIGPISYAIVRIERSTESYDDFPFPHKNIWKLGRVSDNHDLSSPYVEGTDYERYRGGDRILWIIGGSDPGAGNFWYGELFGTIFPAENRVLDVEILLTLQENEDAAEVGESIRKELISYSRKREIDEDIFHYDIASIINRNAGVKYVHDIVLRTTVKMIKGTPDKADLLPVTELSEIHSVSDSEDLSDPYDIGDDYQKGAAAFDIQYTGSSTACVLSISNNKLRTYEKNGSWALVIDYDLTEAANDTIEEIVALINALGDYTCTNNLDVSVASVHLDEQENTDIKTASTEIRINNMLKWVSTGVEPAQYTFYFTDISFRGDLIIGSEEIARIGTVTVTEAS
jgi:hypothetical protein